MYNLSFDEAALLDDINDDVLASLMTHAAEKRKASWGDTMTYSRKVFIPLTNYCRDECKYCTFVKRPGDPKANIMTPGQVLAVAKKGQELGCKEALFSLGEKPELRYREVRSKLSSMGYESMIDYLIDMCELVLKETTVIPHVNAGNLTSEELTKLKKVSASMGLMLESTSEDLLLKGAAHFACPDKIPSLRLATIEKAGKQKIPFTTGILIGIGESWQDRVNSLREINKLHLKYGHIQEVIIQNFCAKPDTEMAEAPEPTLKDMLKTLSVARLLLEPSISLQAPPNLQENFLEYITAGINDWGGISPLTKDFINPDNAWPQIEVLAKDCHSKGFQLQERLTIYPEYLNSKKDFTEMNIKVRVVNMARVDGLAQEQIIVRDIN
jgi:FO synthase